MQPSAIDESQLDPGIVEYIKHEMIEAKLGKNISIQVLNDEVNRLYPLIVEGIYEKIFTNLPIDKQKLIEEKILNGSQMKEVQDIIKENVPDIDVQTNSFMIYITESYLNGEV